MANKKIYLYLAFLVPFLMILILIISILFYASSIPLPKNDFLYVLSKGYNAELCAGEMRRQIYPEIPTGLRKKTSENFCEGTQLYIYHFDTQASTPIAIEKLNTFNFSHSMEEKNSYSISNWCYENNSIWPMSLPHFDVCLRKGKYRKKLNIDLTIDQARYTFAFIAWIENSDKPKETQHD